MNFIEPTIEIWNQDYSGDTDNIIKNLYKQIELAGRTCYKSENNITDDSYKKFIKMLNSNKHYAMFEHGTIYLTIHILKEDKYYDVCRKEDIVLFFINNEYSRVTELGNGKTFSTTYYITTNYRVIAENPYINITNGNLYKKEQSNLFEVIKEYITAPTLHDRRITIHMTTDIGVTREANRHRSNSMAEQSTRYCNYSKEKFGNGLNIALNSDIESEDQISNHIDKCNSFEDICNYIGNNKEISADDFGIIDTWLFANMTAEWSYMRLLKLGWKPQQARRVLPLDTVSELVHTAYIDDWKHFIDLRSIGTTGQPHPDMKIIGDRIRTEIKENDCITH